MKYDFNIRNINNRKSIRLKNFNYSSEWLYFITISIKDKLCLFWEIKNNNELELFEWWKIIEKYWLELENEYENVKLHKFIVMPNHFHGILEIKKSPVGADLVSALMINNQNDLLNINNQNNLGNIDNQNDLGNIDNQNDLLNIYNQNDLGNVDNQNDLGNRVNTRFTPTGGKFEYNKNSISAIIQWFKSKTTHQYIKQVNQNILKPFNKKLWQRNFYEHIIRNEKEYLKISEYIKNNPQKWDEDLFYNSEI